MLFNSLWKSLPSLGENSQYSMELVEVPVFSAGNKFLGISMQLLLLQNSQEKYTCWLAVSCKYGTHYGM
jgi:hypothetical protein